LKKKLTTIKELYELLEEKTGLGRAEISALFIAQDCEHKWTLRLRASAWIETAIHKALCKLCQQRGGNYSREIHTYHIPKTSKTGPKRAVKRRVNHAETFTLGIPSEVLDRIRGEKLTATVCVKVWPSLASYVKQRGGAGFVRKVLLEKLMEE